MQLDTGPADSRGCLARNRLADIAASMPAAAKGLALNLAPVPGKAPEGLEGVGAASLLEGLGGVFHDALLSGA